MHRWFGLGMLLLGAGLALNTLLGPLVADIIDYPFTETVRNETLGLEAVSLVLIAPLAIIAGILALRGHRAAGVVALGPAAYGAYMFVQYIVGPQYSTYEPAVLLHLALLILSGALVVRAWTLIDVGWLPVRSRGWAVVVFLLAAFALSRWAGPLAGVVTNDPLPVAAPDVTMYWSIFLLDLGIVVPVAIVTGIGLLLREPWATKALYGVIGWFALVPPSVAAMAVVKVLRDDPVADAGDTVVLLVVALIFGAVAVWLYAPLFRRPGDPSGV
ncbi:MAG: hypothetical protein U9O18_08275 [Chloroflexota bacterium]|nr:hypothetical protein [Chloroflexota bacterium]